ncbi:MAG: hypothetical protein K0S10_2593, partial [Rubrobacteraceae bacterium]|nr:hypothetical protein [Rubrobacteraceae bacterium]
MRRRASPRKETFDPAEVLARGLGLLPQLGPQLPVLGKDPDVG